MCDLQKIIERVEKTEKDIEKLSSKTDYTLKKLESIDNNIKNSSRSSNLYLRLITLLSAIVPIAIHFFSK